MAVFWSLIVYRIEGTEDVVPHAQAPVNVSTTMSVIPHQQKRRDCKHNINIWKKIVCIQKHNFYVINVIYAISSITPYKINKFCLSLIW